MGTAMIGPDNRISVENRLRQLEGREILSFNSTTTNLKKYDSRRDAEDPSMLKDNKVYNTATDTTISTDMQVDDDDEPKKKSKKRKRSEVNLDEDEPAKKKKKKDKKEKKSKKDKKEKKSKKDKKKRKSES